MLAWVVEYFYLTQGLMVSPSSFFIFENVCEGLEEVCKGSKKVYFGRGEGDAKIFWTKWDKCLTFPFIWISWDPSKAAVLC